MGCCRSRRREHCISVILALLSLICLIGSTVPIAYTLYQVQASISSKIVEHPLLIVIEDALLGIDSHNSPELLEKALSVIKTAIKINGLAPITDLIPVVDDLVKIATKIYRSIVGYIADPEFATSYMGINERDQCKFFKVVFYVFCQELI